MRRKPGLALLLAVVPVLAWTVAVHGADDARIEPVGGILWNDRVDEVHRKLAALPEVRRVEVSVLFNDTVTEAAFGPRAIAPGSGSELSGAVSALVREYLAGVEADRSSGRGALSKAFDLHCAGILADKAGTRKDYLDVALRVSARPVEFQGLPFALTAEFRAHPGAGITGRHALPVEGTKYVLPVILTKVTLVPASPQAEERFPGVAESLGRSFARFRRCAAGASEGWCDDRAVSVSYVTVAARPAGLRYDAEAFWFRGLDALYREHVKTLNGGKSCRCHAPPARGSVF